MQASIFNDVIGPVMRGPSSSHCAAALRIGRLARDLMGGSLEDILVEFDRNGSLPTTHESQGSDMGLAGGLLGWEADDERLPGSMAFLRQSGVLIRFETVDAGDPHPNTYRLTLRRAEETRRLRAISTGGGMIEVQSVDDFSVSMVGDCFETLLWVDNRCHEFAEQLKRTVSGATVLAHEGSEGCLLEVKSDRPVEDAMIAQLTGTFGFRAVRRLSPVLPVLSRPGASAPFTSCSEMLRHDDGRNTPLWRLGVEYEMARGGLSEAEVIEKMVALIRILRRSIAQGIAGTHYDDRVLGHQSGLFKELMSAGRLLDGGALNRIILYVTALMEMKSSMGVIVAAPTAGACAALPGAVIAVAEARGLGEMEMAKAMLAAGVIGIFITTHWSFAAEEGGCQAEGGAAACMAAAALTGMAGGSLKQSLAAASMALQSMLGLICDPIANRVEAPCLGKNVMAASNALACANMALAQFDPLIPFDEVIEAAKRVAGQMPRELRCTALGGLSITPTSKLIEQRLAARTGAACGSCACH
ncbi:MAG: L-serine ammonia-lyase, iron-sulfur-dependent, subunit alpha [Verrucomicrobiales bacterium]|nr:L-serine ammonia-lyase, iron-sulfur-dependent, subunit alpha [Verrucomicrobiales bacterium]